jgi:nudix-type nucleoside diphosphatase (YffH/AdpP family)
MGMSSFRRVDVRTQERILDDFFKVDRVLVSHEHNDGTMSSPERRLIFERGDSVGVMIFNLDTRRVVLVNQFKVPSLIGRRRDDPNTMDGWITEAVAGMVDPGETPEQTVILETEEETGYRIRNPKLIGKFFSSPGGTSERIFLYFAEVRDADRVGKGGGIEGESITVHDVSLKDLFSRLMNGAIEDPKLAIGAYWLKDHLRRRAS